MARPFARIIALLSVGATSLAAGASLFAQQDTVQPIKAQIVPPADLPYYSPQQAVTIRKVSTEAMLQNYQPKRRFNEVQARGPNRTIQLATGEADLSPVLDNDQAPINIGARLADSRQLARVNANELEVVEIDQGIVVRQYLSYRVEPGVCSSPQRRAQLEQHDVSCFERATTTSRVAALADPNNPRFISDPRRRLGAAAEIARVTTRENSQIEQDLSQLRAMLRDPSQRALIDAELGSGQASRLAELDDRALEAEIVNSADIEIEEVMFVPAAEKADFAISGKADFGRAVQPTMTLSPLGRLATPATPPPSPGTLIRRIPGVTPGAIVAAPAAPPVDQSKAIDQEIYLTGFTLGREHEWKKRVSVSIKWCVLGCKKTYYAEVYAGFNYGFGLRFPLKMAGTYRYHSENGQQTATFSPDFSPFNGSSNDYRNAGLPNNKLFEGKELVAQFGAYAGLSYKIPFAGSGVAGYDLDFDATDKLPSPYTNGQFAPPPAGGNTPPITRTFDEVDLIGGRANFGVVGAKVHPAVKFTLTSNALSFKLRDRISGKTVLMDMPGKAYPLAIRSSDKMSRFTVGDPVYNLAFALTPGVVGRLFVDVSVWSKHWDWPVWFPQVTVQLPPGGVSFACHAATVCNRDYDYSPTRQATFVGASGDPISKVATEWASDFETRWQAECPDEPIRLCLTAITSVATTTKNRMLDEMAKAQAGMTGQQAIFASNTVFTSLSNDAELEGYKIVEEARTRARNRR